MDVDPQRGVSNKKEPHWCNVASNQGIKGPVDQIYLRFMEAGFPDEHLPDEMGWMPAAVFPGQILGQRAIAVALTNHLEQAIGRERRYSRAQRWNLMNEGRVLDNCEYPVQSIPAICTTSLRAISCELLATKRRRGRSVGGGTDCCGRSNAPSSSDRALTT